MLPSADVPHSSNFTDLRHVARRGPKAARIYRETRDEAIATGKIKALGSGQQDEQQVQVLRDGFAGFGPKYKVGAPFLTLLF